MPIKEMGEMKRKEKIGIEVKVYVGFYVDFWNGSDVRCLSRSDETCRPAPVLM